MLPAALALWRIVDMAILRDELTDYLDNLLSVKSISDVSNNGVQCEGARELTRAAFAVDACQQTIDAAAETGCEFLFCHHGLSWGGGIARLTSYTQRRFKALLAHDITLYAAHLPLDMHAQYGNNAVLCEMVGIPASAREPFGHYHGQTIGFCGVLSEPQSVTTLAAKLDATLGVGSRSCVWSNRDGAPIRKIGIVSGGGADMIEEAAECGCDCMLTGEAGHQYFHPARELCIDVIAAGHYATETTGPKAVMACVQARFPQLQCQFINIPTGG
jgi:dinuclear metal center YbgI/SA1388 family protein